MQYLRDVLPAFGLMSKFHIFSTYNPQHIYLYLPKRWESDSDLASKEPVWRL